MTLTATTPANPITDWLDLLYSNFTEGHLTAFSVDRTTGARHTDWAPVTQPHNLHTAVHPRIAQSCVWFGVATRRTQLGNGSRGGADDCLHLPGLWLDIDIAGPNHRTTATLPPDRDAAWQLINDLPVPPTVVVDTGGGLQPWWLFAEPLDADAEARTLLDRWGATWAAKSHARGWHLDNVFDLARIMRLPGTWNQKTERQTQVVHVVQTLGHRYGVDDLDPHLHDPPAPRAAQADRVPYIGPARPGDAFNAMRTPGYVLNNAGWTHARTDPNGDEHWTRPGKDPREGTSATVYADDGHTTIWSSEVEHQFPTIEVRRPYDAFGLFVHMKHGGDFTKASDELERAGYGTKSAPELTTIGDAHKPSGPDEHNAYADGATVGSSWARTPIADVVQGIQDGTIEAARPTLGVREDGAALFYRGRVNGLYGEPGKGKTWIALAVAAEQLAAGESVAWIDLEEPAHGIVGRLLALGVEAEAIVERFAHFAPEEPIRNAHGLGETLRTLAPSLVVIDSTGEALALEGLGPNNDDEVAKWFQTWPRWIATETGAGVIVIDHVVKDEQTRGNWPGGSQRKKAAINGSAFMAATIRDLGRGIEGRLKLTTSKDRHGHHAPNRRAGQFVLDAQDPEHIKWKIETPEETPTGDDWKPTTLMERVAQFLAGHAGPASKNTIETGVKGNRDHIRKAIVELTASGHVGTQMDGQYPRFVLLKPYPDPIPEATEIVPVY